METCIFPERLHPASELLLRAWLGQEPGDPYFDTLLDKYGFLCEMSWWIRQACAGWGVSDDMMLRYFHIMNSSYLELAQCLVGNAQ